MSVISKMIIAVLAVFVLGACGKQKATGPNSNGTLNAQQTPTYALAEYDADFNNFELMIDDLYNVGIEPVFDQSGLIVDFDYYSASPNEQVTALNEVASTSDQLLRKYNRQYYVAAGSVTYLAQLNAVRVQELKTVKTQAVSVASEILSGSYKPQQGKAKASAKISDREITDWETRVSAATARPPKKDPKDDDGGDPQTGRGKKKRVSLASLISVANATPENPPKDDDGGDDPQTSRR